MYNRVGLPTKTIKTSKEDQVMKLDTDSLAHTQWNCKYHIVFAPKYRRQIIYGKIKSDIGTMLRKLCEYKGIEIIEAEACKDHIHMLVSIPPKYSVSQIMGYLKGKSSLMIFEKYANLKYKYGNRHFWCRGYYVDTVGRNKKAIEQYIRNQLQQDYEDDQLSIKEFVDPFTGEPVKEGK
jgi:putative transposase